MDVKNWIEWREYDLCYGTDYFIAGIEINLWPNMGEKGKPETKGKGELGGGQFGEYIGIGTI
jgi:hypothetical protein